MLKKGSAVETIFDEYKVVAQINQGGSGTVFKIENSDGQMLALKAIDRSRTSKDKLKRFKNELAFCQNDNHENIIRILDHGTYHTDGENIIFYIMPLYPMTLREKMSSGMNAEEVLPIVSQLFDAIKYAHGKNIWHRDIKPENILIDSKGTVVLADFGIAHFCANELITAVETKKSDRLANFTYAAPEQRIKGAAIDGRADTFAIGLLINEMFTGKVIAGANYETIEASIPQCGYLDKIIEQMICQNPNDRLYPVEKIAVQILAAQTREQESIKLFALTSNGTEPDESFNESAVPSITGCEYKDGVLYIHLKDLDYYNSQIWFSELQQGKFSHSSLMRYDTNQLHMVNYELIKMPVPTSDASAVKQIAQSIKEWLTPATANFNTKQRVAFENEKREKARKLQVEIERLQAEAKAREDLSSFTL